jgi:hypothetical protein
MVTNIFSLNNIPRYITVTPQNTSFAKPLQKGPQFSAKKMAGKS